MYKRIKMFTFFILYIIIRIQLHYYIYQIRIRIRIRIRCNSLLDHFISNNSHFTYIHICVTGYLPERKIAPVKIELKYPKMKVFF